MTIQTESRRTEPDVTKTIKVLLVDDHGMVRECLRSYLERHRHLKVVGEAAHGNEALQKMKNLQPDIVVLDIDLPASHGFATLQRIQAEMPKFKTVVITAHKNPEYVIRAFRLGVAGYVLKDASSQELLDAIEAVNSGKTFINPNLGGEVICSKQRSDEEAKRSVSLSIRERDVLARIARGQTSKEIAQHFHVAVRTIQTHRERIMKKLNIHSVAGLTQYALTHLNDDAQY